MFVHGRSSVVICTSPHIPCAYTDGGIMIIEHVGSTRVQLQFCLIGLGLGLG